MMFEEIRKIKSGKKELQQFGITLGVVLALFGGLFFLRGKGHYFYLFAFSATFILLGAVASAILRPIQKVWMSIALILGWLATRLILIILFYLVVTPIGILAKIFGKDFLDAKLDKGAESYWIAREPVEFDRSSYERQF